MQEIFNWIGIHPYLTTSIVVGVVFFLWLSIKVGFIGGLLELIGDMLS